MVSLQSIAVSLAVLLLAVGLTSNGMAAPYKKRSKAGTTRTVAMPGRSSADHGYEGGYGGGSMRPNPRVANPGGR